MLEGFKALLGSEKAIAGGMLIIGATILTAMGLMTVVDWQGYTSQIFMVYVGGKVVQGAMSTWADAKKFAPADTSTTTTQVKTEVKTDATH